MKLINVLLCCCIAFVACQKSGKPEKVEASQGSIERNAPMTTTQATNQCIDFFSILNGIEQALPIVGANSKRLSTAQIDSILTNYVKGNLVSDSAFGTNECNGEEIRKKCFANHIVEFGAFYSLYARSYYFSGEFNNIMGISKGSTNDQVKEIFGAPYKSNGNVLLYLSEKPSGEDAELFDSRWNIFFLIKDNVIDGIAFYPNFNDC